MSLAKTIMNKFAATRYKLHYEPLDMYFYISPMTVGQRQAAQKFKDEDKQQAYVFSECVFDEDNALVVNTVKEVEMLPELLVGLCCAVVMQLTTGANHATCDKVVSHFIKSVNITDSDELLELKKEELELQEEIKEQTSLKNV